MNWSTEQLQMLRAMGHEVLVRAGAVEPLAVEAPTSAGAASGDVVARGAVDPAMFGALQLALRRAAGDRDVTGLVGDLERLRRDPLLKRALWPRLRALRRSH